MASSDYARIAAAIQFIASNRTTQPDLKAVADSLHLSEYHFQRLFSQWAGVSPKRFMQFLTKEHAKTLLAHSKSVLETSLEVGLSGTSRLHDLMVTCEAMTPGEIKAQGKGLIIHYGKIDTPFGDALIAWTQRGICHFDFYNVLDPQPEEQYLFSQWKQAKFIPDELGATQLRQQIFATTQSVSKPLHLLLRGTNFQLKVWEALLKVKPGSLVSYSHLAKLAGSPKAARAVGTALANNTIGFLIPCHRVIRETGEIGNYRWGEERKTLMQAWEASKNDTSHQ